MGAIAGIVAPIFALIGLGAAARYWRWIDPAGQRGINDLTFYLLIPALLFSAVAEAQVIAGLDVAVVYFSCCLTVFAAGLLLARRVLQARLDQATVIGLNCAYGNTVMLGLPIVSAAFGPQGVAILLPIIALHSAVLLPLATVLIEAGGVQDGHPVMKAIRTLPSLGRNPVIVAIVVALLWRVIGVPVPVPLHRLTTLLAAAGPALALFSLGASLPGFAMQGSLRETGIATVLKLAIFPLLVWVVARVVGLGPVPIAVAVLTAGAPTGANAFFLARRTGTLASESAGTVVVSTALSVLTLTALLALMVGAG